MTVHERGARDLGDVAGRAHSESVGGGSVEWRTDEVEPGDSPARGTAGRPRPRRRPESLAADAIFSDAAADGNPISVAQWERFVGTLRARSRDDGDGVAASHDHADTMLLQLDDLIERLEQLGGRTESAVRGLRTLQASIAAAGGRTVPRRRPGPSDRVADAPSS